MENSVYTLTMPNISIYLPGELAKSLDAAKDRLNVSAICQGALREELSIVQAVENQEDMERIEVDVDNQDGTLRTLAFTGRWLVGTTGLDPDDCEPGVSYNVGTYWSIALTRRGRIAVMSPPPTATGASSTTTTTLTRRRPKASPRASSPLPAAS